MSRKTFWCIVVTAGGGAALMFAVKLAKNFKNFEKKRPKKDTWNQWVKKSVTLKNLS